ncbi:putative pyridine nucleotide-disulfide oxidoreductase YkgC [Carnobacterium sp. 17-4]|uniref:FAD-dependent oxidoreductase n=1 Tax=Carnobacterium sp. (strain 17-4) TaxID=208596 RepID=UPI0002059355|nr:FAD-dependent oxidoreductase [Carnobacterium sp. 17-4]AEB30422.1 putative pyridine nucleotide-disulfide oxidoreductase YkgC [Carnobacterium sp. 17-4]
MKKYDAIIIGFGQGARTLATKLTTNEWKVALIEKNELMYGGSCVNIGCIPTKILEHDAREQKDYTTALKRKNEVTQRNRNTEFTSMQKNERVDLYTGTGSFKSNHVITVDLGDKKEELEAEYIFIDTGSESNYPPIEGLKETKKIYNSTELQSLPEVPKNLGIIGAGNIGLEFASIYEMFGSKVTLFETGEQFMPKEEREVAEAVQKVMTDKSIDIQLNARVNKLSNENEQVKIETEENESFLFDAVLIATGRKPNTAYLNLDDTDIVIDEKGGIEVNDYLETAVENVFALGDVRGGYQFTYITINDAKLIADYVLGKGNRKRSERQHVPYSIFMEPSFARVGLTETEATEQGYQVITNTAPVSGTTRSDVINDTRGLYKAVINKETDEILGVTLFGDQAHELVNQVKMAMDNHIPYTYLRDQVITHPVMSEIFNTLFDL